MDKTEQRTKARGFHFIPVDDLNLMQVAAGIDSFHAVGVADVATDFVHRFIRESMTSSNGEAVVPMHYDDLMVLDLLMEMAAALRYAAGESA